ncbi:hypothetical protein PR048_007208 [Dryococelus australis]|uniref:Uncharacterized protein n=1 Tax=Dryococelus australis TaxID=614101 RepID=A0ABQ9ID11_9NEOP|nr:hypothetical protein PR048_007208 [Dryococelus australis]
MLIPGDWRQLARWSDMPPGYMWQTPSQPGAAVVVVARPLASQPRRTGFESRHFQSARGDRAGRCGWSVGFLGDLRFHPPLHSDADPRPSLFALVGLLDLSMMVIERSMELRRNKRVGEAGYPRENPPTKGIFWNDSHMRKSGVIRLGIEPGSHWWEASRLTAQPPRPQSIYAYKVVRLVGISSAYFSGIENTICGNWVIALLSNFQVRANNGCQVLANHAYKVQMLATILSTGGLTTIRRIRQSSVRHSVIRLCFRPAVESDSQLSAVRLAIESLTSTKINESLSSTKINESLSSTKINESLSSTKINESLTSTKINESLSSTKINESLSSTKINESLSSTKINESLTSTKINESLSSTKINESLSSTKINESLSSTKINESLSSTKINESLSSTKINESLSSTKINESLTSTKINESLSSTKINESLSSTKINESLSSTKINESLTSTKVNENLSSTKINESFTSTKATVRRSPRHLSTSDPQPGKITQYGYVRLLETDSGIENKKRIDARVPLMWTYPFVVRPREVLVGVKSRKQRAIWGESIAAARRGRVLAISVATAAECGWAKAAPRNSSAINPLQQHIEDAAVQIQELRSSISPKCPRKIAGKLVSRWLEFTINGAFSKALFSIYLFEQISKSRQAYVNTFVSVRTRLHTNTGTSETLLFLSLRGSGRVVHLIRNGCSTETVRFRTWVPIQKIVYLVPSTSITSGISEHPVYMGDWELSRRNGRSFLADDYKGVDINYNQETLTSDHTQGDALCFAVPKKNMIKAVHGKVAMKGTSIGDWGGPVGYQPAGRPADDSPYQPLPLCAVRGGLFSPPGDSAPLSLDGATPAELVAAAHVSLAGPSLNKQRQHGVAVSLMWVYGLARGCDGTGRYVRLATTWCERFPIGCRLASNSPVARAPNSGAAVGQWLEKPNSGAAVFQWAENLIVVPQ